MLYYTITTSSYLYYTISYVDAIQPEDQLLVELEPLRDVRVDPFTYVYIYIYIYTYIHKHVYIYIYIYIYILLLTLFNHCFNIFVCYY